MNDARLIPISHLELDLPAPTTGWLIELDRRHITVIDDDLGRKAISRSDARQLFGEHLEDEARRNRHREETERRAIEADQRFRSQIAAGIPFDAVPAGMTAAELMMASDPMSEGSRRESVLEHALAHQAGAIVYHPLQEDQ
jgi:hypothetical protein